jgi:hypothetical protein
MALHGTREKVVHSQINAIRPAKADDVCFISAGDLNVGGAADDVVFFADGAIFQEAREDCLGEFACDTLGVGGVAVVDEAFDCEP